MRRSRIAFGVAVAVAVVVTAVTSASALGAASPSPAAPQRGGFKVARGCFYPPQTRPAVVVSAPSSVRRSRSFTVSGTVKYNSCGLGVWPVTVYRSSGSTFVQVGSTLTSGGGAFTLTVPGITASTQYRAVTPPWLGLDSSTSNTVTVSVSG